MPTPPPDSRELVRTLSIEVGVAFSRPADLPRWIQLDFATSAWAVRSPSTAFVTGVTDEIRIGQLVMRVLHTPGHRPESISLLVVNPADALGIAWAMAAIAGLTVVSGVIVLCRMYETLP